MARKFGLVSIWVMLYATTYLGAQTQSTTITFNHVFCVSQSNYFDRKLIFTIDHTTLFGSDIINGSMQDNYVDACPGNPPVSDEIVFIDGQETWFFGKDGAPTIPFPSGPISGDFGLLASPGADTVHFQLQVAQSIGQPDLVQFCYNLECPIGGVLLFNVTFTPDQTSDLGPCQQCEASAGSPINLTNGNVWIPHQDYSLPGLGGGLGLIRTWNSLWTAQNPFETVGMFGDSWQSTYEEHLQTLTNTAKYWRGDGSAWMFTFNSGTSSYTLTSPPDERASLVVNSTTSQATVTFLDGSSRVFNSAGNLIAVIDRNGNQATVAYDGSNRIASVTDAASRSVSFTYGNPSFPNLVTSVQDAVGTIATYAYDASAHLTSVTYADNSAINYAYDANGLITGTTDALSKVLETHTYSGRQGISSSRANGSDSLTVSYGTGVATLTDSKGNATQYSRTNIGSRNFVTSVAGTGCDSCGGNGNQSFTYDSSGNRLTSTDPLGHKTTYTYDSNGDVTSSSISVGGVNVVSNYTYNGFGEVLTATDPLGHVTTNTYDSHGNLLTTTTPSPGGKTAGSTTSFVYDTKGELTQVTDPLGHVAKIAYTSAGLVNTITDPLNKVTTYGYDPRGNRTSITDALNNQTTFQYDAVNRLTKITRPDQTTIGFAYDVRGRRTSVTDENNKTTQYAYDDADRLTSVTDANNGVTQYAYDSENNLNSITDALLHTTSFAYDSQRRVTQTTFPSTKFETYAYDANSNLTSKTDRKNQTITYSYDELNRLTKKQYPDSTAVSYTFDAASRLTQVVDPTGTYSYTYDNMDRLTQASSVYSVLSSKTFSVSYSYDAASNRTGFTDANGSSTSYTYDTLNRLTQIKDFNRNAFSFSYDPLSRTTQMTRPNGVNSNYQYDGVSNLLSVLHQNGTTTLDGATYTYDPAGNRKSKTNQLNSVVSSFAYDNLYELTGVTQGASTVEAYTYDAVGNRLSSASVATYSYDASNELQSAGAASYTYDANGNTLTKTDSTGTTNYAWDFENRLISLTPPGGTAVTFKYDPFGRRIQKGSSLYVYDGSNLIQESDSSGNLVARYIQALGIDQPLAAYRGKTSEFYEADGLGSVTSLSTSAGVVNQTYVFDSFGNASSTTGTFTQPFRFTGREYDSETGLLYYRARYYAPDMGRFASEDPLRFDAGMNFSNFYPYVSNNPIRYNDPFGLSQQDVQLILGLAQKLTDQMTKNGERISPGPLNNFLASLQWLASPFRKKAPFKGCGQQADRLAADLQFRHYDDHWTFEVIDVERGFHQIGIARSSNPNDPDVIFDPWNYEFFTVPRGWKPGSILKGLGWKGD
jgi:RHS repeat-associated protein